MHCDSSSKLPLSTGRGYNVQQVEYGTVGVCTNLGYSTNQSLNLQYQMSDLLCGDLPPVSNLNAASFFFPFSITSPD